MGKTIYAFCWAGGQIEFGRRIPDGALPIMRGAESIVRETMSVAARHAYDGVTLLVPGVPEAPNQMAAVDALIRFRKWLHDRTRSEGGQQMSKQGEPS